MHAIRTTAALTAAISALVLGLAGVGQASAGCKRSLAADGKQRFQIKGADVHDRTTGLVWQRCSLGTQWSAAGGCTGERTAYFFPDAEQAARAAGAPWRMPTADELGSLVDRDCGLPAIDVTVFPDVPAATDEGANVYWTATRGGLEKMMYAIDFSEGYGDIRSPGFGMYVRLVRTPK